MKIIQKKQLTNFSQTSAIVWLVYMFCLNWESLTAWLCFRLSQSEQDQIITDFNNSNDSLEILLSIHAIENFEINLQINCHNMIVLEHFRNLNTLLQTMTWLQRIDQKSEVYIWIFFVDHTFHCWWCSNLAHKTILNLETQLDEKLRSDQKADVSIINEHAEKTLNMLIRWSQNHSHWNDVTQLNFKMSFLLSMQQKIFANIAFASTTFSSAKE